MKVKFLTICLLLVVLIGMPFKGVAQILTSSTIINISKSWYQQPGGYTYPIKILVPPGPVPLEGFPVCILLHGNGSQNLGQLAGPPMLSETQFGSVLPCHILIAPTGYQNTWNICAENSDAPDIEMINDLVNQVQSYANVNPTKIRILGTSNGAGLANRIFIENMNPGIDIICAVVSHLNDFQYHSGDFYKPSSITSSSSSYCGYDIISNPRASRKYLSISNINDPIIPYLGGTSVVGANFLPAESAAFNIAAFKGYTGSILSTGTVIGSGPNAITEYAYLDGDVVHLKGNAGHQSNTTQKNYIKNYFSDCEEATGFESKENVQVKCYPNPVESKLNIEVNENWIRSNYAIYDNLGRVLNYGNLTSLNTVINLSSLSNGIYFLEIGDSFKTIFKIAKN